MVKITKKNKIIIAASVLFFICVLIVVLIGFTFLEKKHREEIERVILLRDGEEIEITKVDAVNSPFAKESTNSNLIYKITYQIEKKDFVAWYRGSNNLADIHAEAAGAYPEKWIFEEDAKIQKLLLEKSAILKIVETIRDRDTPFNNQSNTGKNYNFYKITYHKNGSEHIAWYREVIMEESTLTELHDEWIFE
ncbi:hypothetical protein [Longirhabdus pacifica]|uniref:hypothetical protein n=1 Tax=Longirhabdus pacifica TaxID=2305227 RepID=UPI0010092877|nr:hypothetical protein [Longirhabdus pacifica]